LTKTDNGSIIVTNWAKHQADPTARIRKERFQNAHGTESERNENALEKSRVEKKRKDYSSSNTKPMSVAEILMRRGQE
jgi:SOS response regulatory protein OraA/RecX